MSAHWQRSVEPELEPLTLEVAKRHCRIHPAITDEDADITRLIAAARQIIEQWINRGLLTQTWVYTQDDWADEIYLPMAAPLQAVVSVQYYAGDGVLTTLDPSAYDVVTTSEPARIALAPGASWPERQGDKRGAIVITYRVGWEAAADVPEALVQATAVLVNHLYGQGREAVRAGAVSVMPFTVEALLAPFRVFWREPQYL